MLPFMWALFLLLHLGGQSTIMAFSVEDNNICMRYFLNRVVQVTLFLYAIWKSSIALDIQLLMIAALVFVAGLIK